MNKISKYKLPNGLTVLLNYQPDFVGGSAGICFNVGSLSSNSVIHVKGKEIFVPLGAAHFLEHRLFEYRGESVIDLFSTIGCSCDAFTSFDKTVYFFTGAENLKLALQLLLEFTSEFSSNTASIEKEKNIIIEELKMYLDDSDSALFAGLLNNLYHNHLIKEDIGGTIDSVNATTRAQLKAIFDYFYHPSNALLVVSGDFEEMAIKRLIKKHSANFENEAEITKVVFPEPDNIVAIHEEKTMDVFATSAAVGIKMIPGDKCYLKTVYRLLLDVVFSPMSPYYNKLTKKGVIPGYIYYDYCCYDDVAWILVRADTEHSGEFLEAVKYAFAHIEDFINAKIFKAVKRSRIGHCILKTNTPAEAMLDLLHNYQNKTNSTSLVKVLKKITLADLKRAAKNIDISKLTSFVIRPEK